MDPSMALGAANAAASMFPSLTDWFNFGSTQLANHQNREFSREMYDRQRADAIEFWNMNNAYNSPSAQMERFKAAGLNPNLIYGQGNVSGGPVSVPDVQPLNARAANFQGSTNNRLDPLMFADLRIKNAQASNLETQTAVIREEARYKKALADRTALDYNLENELYSTNADARRAGLQKTKTEIQVMTDRNAREAAMNTSNLREAGERILSMQSTRLTQAVGRAHTRADIDRVRAETDRIHKNIEIMEKEGIFKDLQNEMMRLGVTPGSPWYAQIVGRFAQTLNEDSGFLSAARSSVIDFILGR